ncbi:MAG: 50S ribosomal protein L9 [Alphaproteobacteria bacterium]|nr:50S ribosomal protein L9 [Alphaproteobacteria bacterium]PHX99577.1 MAG: 50S ribosomal protein L9 [Rhodospirillaceae bacterium]
MQVILLERIERLGALGDVVNVKPGFARNFLLPRKKALRANKDNMTYFESKRSELEALNAKHRDEAQGIAGKLDGFKLVLVRQAGEGGQLYGSVSARDIADALIEHKFKVERTQVVLANPIKVLGVTKIPVRLHADVKVIVEVTIARSMEKADLEAAQAASMLERPEDAEKLLGAPAQPEAEGADTATDEEEASAA